MSTLNFCFESYGSEYSCHIKKDYMINLVDVLGTGVPRLACLRPAAWLKWGPSAAHLHQHKLKTLARGQASRGGRQRASLSTSSSGRAREEAKRSMQGYLARIQ